MKKLMYTFYTSNCFTTDKYYDVEECDDDKYFIATDNDGDKCYIPKSNFKLI